MADWSRSMQQTYEYYIVDPNTWRDMRRLDTVVSCSINRDLESETLGSATIDITDSIGEAYIRVYLITLQNDIRERFPLGTYLVQTPSSTFNGKIRNVTMDAYTPLLELKEKMPPIGYTITKDKNVMDLAYEIVRENARAPVVKTTKSDKLNVDFVANTSDTWAVYVKDLISTIDYRLELDEMGRILFAPRQETAALQAVWTYDDSNSSILYPELSMDHDMYGIPNVVEVVYSNGSDKFYSRVANTDDNSPLSINNRGREIIHRVTDPSVIGNATQLQIDRYAEKLLKDLSSIEYTLTYTHGYCPVRVGDCVRLNYKLAGITGIKARVISQTIDCEPGCPVTEKAVFTARLWR